MFVTFEPFADKGCQLGVLGALAVKFFLSVWRLSSWAGNFAQA
jgi:hypothetical protein